MPNRLEDLTLEEISVVDEPANKRARVVLLKRAQEKGGIMTDDKERIGLADRLLKYLGVTSDQLAGPTVRKGDDDMADAEVKKQLDDMSAKIEKLEADAARAAKREDLGRRIAKAKTDDDVAAVRKDVDATKADDADGHADLTARLDERAAELGKTEKASLMGDFRTQLPKGLQKAFDDMDDDEKKRFMDKFKKGDETDPVGKALEAVTKKNEALEGEVKALKAAREIDEAREELKDLMGHVEKYDDFVESVVSLRKADKDAAEVLVKSARAMAAREKKSGIFKIVGADGHAAEDAAAEIRKAADAVRKEDPKLTPEQAEALTLERNLGLYTKYLAEREA